MNYWVKKDLELANREKVVCQLQEVEVTEHGEYIVNLCGAAAKIIRKLQNEIQDVSDQAHRNARQ